MNLFRFDRRGLGRLWTRLMQQARRLREERRPTRRGRRARLAAPAGHVWQVSPVLSLESRTLLTTTITTSTDLSGYFDANGNFSISDSDQITIESGVIISSSSTSGAAGSISLSSPMIVLQSGAQLLATGSTSAGDGAITLTANNVQYGSTATPLVQMIRDTPTNSSIQIGSNVTITGGTVNIQSWAGDSISEQNYANSLPSFYKDVINDATNDFNTGFGALPFSILIKQPTSAITIGSGSAITSSGSVLVASKSTPYAVSEAIFGSALTSLIGSAWRKNWIENQSAGFSFAWSYTDASATVQLQSNASISAPFGSVALTTSTINTTTALSDASKNVTNNLSYVDPNTLLLSLGVSLLGTTSVAQVDAGATITAGQTVLLDASAEDKSGAKADSASFKDGKFGASGSYSHVNANVRAIVNGTISAGAQALLPTLTFNPNFTVNFATNSLVFPSATGYTTGTPILYEAGTDGTSIPGLVSGRTYYTIPQSATALQLATSLQDALNGNPISFGAGFPTLSSTNGTLPISVVSGTGTGEIFYDFGSWANGTTPLFTTGQSVTYAPLAGQFIGYSDGNGNYVGPLQAGSYTVNVVNSAVTAENPFSLQLLDSSGNVIPLTTNPLLTASTGTVYQVCNFQPASSSLNLNFPTQGTGAGQVSYPTPKSVGHHRPTDHGQLPGLHPAARIPVLGTGRRPDVLCRGQSGESRGHPAGRDLRPGDGRQSGDAESPGPRRFGEPAGGE